MAQAVGYAVLPVLPSMAGFGKELQKQLVGPMSAAGKRASSSAAKSAQDVVNNLERQVKASTSKVEKYHRAQENSVFNVESAHLKVKAAIADQEAAEKAYQDVLSKGGDASRALGKLERAKAKVVDETRKHRKAEIEAQDAEAQHAAQSKDLADTQDRLSKAQKNAAEEAERSKGIFGKLRSSFRDASNEAREAGGAFEGMAGKIGGIAGALGGVAGAGAFAGLGASLQQETDLINLQLGYTGEAAKGVGDSIRESLKSGVASSSEDAANAIGSLESQFKNLGTNGEQTAGELSDNFLAFSKVFGVDLPEATQTAGQLITNGLAPDVETAADLMTAAMQRVPKEMQEELPEIINEYGTNFANLGFSGEEAFSMLVSQADKGKWALDKTGDSLKEFTIRGSDMSKTSVDAYGKLGLSAEDMASKIASGGDGAQDALRETADRLLQIEDPAERANTAIALFGTPLEDLGVDQIPTFLEGLGSAGGEMDGFAGSSQAAADTIANSLQGRLDTLKGTVQAVAGDAFMKLWDVVQNKVIPVFQSAFEWMKKHEGLMITIGGAAAGVVAGFVAIKTVQAGMWAVSAISMFVKTLAAMPALLAAQRAGTLQATAAQMGLNGALVANPIGAVVIAVMAIVGALALFFTKTETGRQVWANFTEFLKAAWQTVSDKFTEVWNWLRDNVFTPMVNFFTQTLWPTVQNVVQWISDRWTWMRDVFTNVWNWIRDVVISPFVNFMTNFLWPNVMNVVQWIGDKWNWMKDIFTAAWNWIRDSVINPFVSFMTTVLWPNIMNVVQWIVDKWNWMRDMLTAVWNWIRDNVIQMFINGANNLWDVIQSVIGWIVDKWNWMRDRLYDGWRWIDDNVFSPLKSGLDIVKGWFETTVDNIGLAWERIREKTAAPIRFVVNTVYNDGIRKAWNAVAKFVGMEDKSLEEIRFASGGVMPGYTPGRDPYTFVDPKSGYRLGLSGGEAIMRPEWTKAIGGPAAVEAMNASARRGGVRGVRRQLGEGAAFAAGGTIDENIERTMRDLQPEHGKPYQYGGVGNPSWDCSGLWSGIVQSLNGGNLRDGRIFNTESDFASFGFEPGLSGRVTIGVMNGGGGMNSHMAGTIDGTNLESGGSNGVQIGGAAIGSDASSLPNRYTLTKFLGEFVSGGNGGGGGNPIARMAKAAWDKVMDILPATPSYPGWIGEWPGKAKDMFVDSMWNWVKSKLPFGGGGRQGGVGAGVEQWRGLVENVLAAKGYDRGMADTVLRRMNQESGGDPSAINNWDSNAAAGTPSKGLMQVIDPTFQANKDPGYDDIWDPEANLRASMNYAVRQYGSLPAAYDRAGGYHAGGLAGFGQGVLRKTAMEPEMVLDPAMTQAFIDWMGVAGDVAKAVQPTAAKSANSYITGQAESVLGIFGLGSVATSAGSWWDKNGEQVAADALSLYGATQNPDSVATVGAFGQSATFEFNAESLDDVVRVGDLTAALNKVGVQTNVRRKPTGVLTRGSAM